MIENLKGKTDGRKGLRHHHMLTYAYGDQELACAQTLESVGSSEMCLRLVFDGRRMRIQNSLDLNDEDLRM